MKADAAHVAAVAEALFLLDYPAGGVIPEGDHGCDSCVDNDNFGPVAYADPVTEAWLCRQCVADARLDAQRVATVAVETLTPLIRAQVAAEIRAAITWGVNRDTDLLNDGLRDAVRIAEATP